jgi:MoxR-like ATPase
MAGMQPELQEALDFHRAVMAEGSRALVGYDTAKALANVVLLAEIPTTYDEKRPERQVNAGNLLLRGVPGVGKTFFGVILAAISDARFARIQGRADLQPTEVVGFQMINPATGLMVTEFGPMASAEVILLDEINRIPLKSQSAFLEGLQDRSITVGKETYELPAFSFAIATMNPVELGQGTFPLSEAATDRFAAMINIGYLPPVEEEKLVDFDFKRVRLRPILSKQRIIELRGRITGGVFLHRSLGRYIQRLVAATRPYNADTDWRQRSPSEMVERGVDLGASPRAIIAWSRLAKVWALLQCARAEVYPEDIQALAPFVLGHRIWLGPHAASHGLSTDDVIRDVVDQVPIP